MIGYLNGIVRESRPPVILVDVNGVGYEVHTTSRVIANLPPQGESAQFYTHLAVSAESQSMYAFQEFAEREVFRILLTVNGIGPKVALSILSEMSVADLAASIRLENSVDFKKVPGIGSKTADRLILELRGKLDEYSHSQIADAEDSLGNSSAMVRDIIDALIALGYSSRESSQAVIAIREDIESVEQGLRMALASVGTAAR